MTPTLHIDFETRSAVDLKKTGAYVYAEDQSTDVWCAAFSVDDEPVGLWHPDLDDRDLRHALNHCPQKVAHNAAFERAISRLLMVRRYGWPEIPVEQWRCTMAQAYAMALPGSLAEAAAAVGLDIAKDLDGQRLMMRMARPRKVEEGWTGRNCPRCDGQGTYWSDDGEHEIKCGGCGGTGEEYGNKYTWWDDEERRNRLYTYCRTDVEVERQLDKKLYRLSADEQRLWHLDQVVNDRGVAVDVEFCETAKQVAATTTARLNAEMRKATLGEVPACSNAAALVAWLGTRGVNTLSVDKANLDALLKLDDLPADCRRALLLRQEAAKSSVKKVDTLLNGTDSRGRASGLLQFHAASTGRWAGRRFQPQNLPRPTLINSDDDEVMVRIQEDAIRAIKTGRAEVVEALAGPPLTVISDCIRGALKADPGKALNVADFSNIEGRVLAWLAGEETKLDAFRAYDAGTGPDLYKVAAGGIYGIAPPAVDKTQRQIGKVSELACGYQGGVGAFQTMASTYRVKVPDEQAKEIVDAWRAANPNIVQFWRDLENAAIEAVSEPGLAVKCGPVRFVVRGAMLGLQLPSGRVLSYAYPKLVEKEMPWRDRNGQKVFRDAVTYMGVNSYTRRWERQDTYGGKWAENVTQAVARDVMREAMFRVEDAGYPIILTVHDELVTEPDEQHGSAEEFNALVATLPAWAKGLPVAADGWRGARYRK